MKKITVGLTEVVFINGKAIKAKIDTGADYSSICRTLVEKLNLTPIKKKRKIRSSTGKEIRDIYRAQIQLRGRVIDIEFTIAKSEHLKYQVVIG